ncbi:methionyl-tRNA synthetase [Sistotremastrum niveocremeum HHB9708]|uniref:methionine--tRNA ligase n=1 Tax=Sistotremastrum niveocremeum HHB9708 TaxID=1314777 RepID=A0A164TS82_9AGAM|nr:methionyl-tRNA synthetase [Sistotremastrum niveocremeum HHB9708]
MAQNIRKADNLLRRVPKDGEIVLPLEGQRNILITSALPYCNNVPHLGNIIGSTLSADVFSRGLQTLYICGTDEYGTATETQALKEGVTPKELCDKYHALHRATYEWFEIGFDYFSRTSTEKHTEICQEVYMNLENNDLLITKNDLQVYCEGCSKFLADRFVEGICPNCGYNDARGDQCDKCSKTFDATELIKPRCLVDPNHHVSTRLSSHKYLRLDVIQPRTEEWIKKSWAAGKWSPNSVINADGEIIDSRIKSGLKPTPITRDLTWGVPVPPSVQESDPSLKGKVLYVWFDACLGYPSITANYTPEWRQWWFNPENVQLYQFMGKDNVYFHTVYFPSYQMGDGRPWTKLHHVSTTEFLNYEGGKFSKSRNLGVFGPAAKETGVPASVWRYYLLATRPETADSMFSWTEFIAANNNVLLNNFGNFVNRALKFVEAKFEGVIPDSKDPEGPLPLDDLDSDFVHEVNTLLTTFIESMDAVKLRTGLQTVMLLSARGNLYLQQAGLGNSLLAENPERCAQVISRAINLIYLLSAAVYPFMPSVSESILTQLNAPARLIAGEISNDILAGHKIGKPEHLFKKIDEKGAEGWKKRFGTNEPLPSSEPLKSKKAAKREATATSAAAVTEEAKPKSPEELVAAERVKAQGDIVRKLKAEKASAEDVKEAVALLNKLKIEAKVLEGST